MKFGIFYEHQLPRPWDDGSEHKLLKDALEQVQLADELGIDYVWEVEHHFLDEYSHSSAPEVFLAACSQRTSRIRLGHGEGDQVPVAVPRVALGVLGVRLQRAGAGRGQDAQPRVGGQVHGPLSDPVALEQTLAHEAAQARTHLLGRAAARLGHRERVGGGDRPVVAGDAEHEDPRGKVAVADRARVDAGHGTGVWAGDERTGRSPTGRFQHGRQ